MDKYTLQYSSNRPVISLIGNVGVFAQVLDGWQGQYDNYRHRHIGSTKS